MLSGGVARGLYLADTDAKAWDYAEQAAQADDSELAMLVLRTSRLSGTWARDTGSEYEREHDLGQWIYSGPLPPAAVTRAFYIDLETDEEIAIAPAGRNPEPPEPGPDADDETFIAWVEAVADRKAKGVEQIRRRIEAALQRGDVFSTPNAFPRGGTTVVHRSTKGKRYQLTWLDDDGPVGDTEPPTLQAAAERVWEDLDVAQRDAFVMAPEGRASNPGLLPGAPPNYLGGGGLSPSQWGYRGRVIVVDQARAGAWKAEWKESVRIGSGTQLRDLNAYARDEQAALAQARVWIDVYDLGWFGPWSVAREAVSHALGAGVPPDRAHVARLIQVRERDYRQSGLAVPKDLVEFMNLPLSDRLRLIDAAVDAYGHTPTSNPGRRATGRRSNPTVLLPGEFPQYVMGGAMSGTPSLWTYRGRRIEVAPQSNSARWTAEVVHPKSPAVLNASGPDEAGALLRLRYWIDVEDADIYPAVMVVQNAIEDLYAKNVKIGRASVARQVEHTRRDPHAASRAGMEAFDALPLARRLQVIDATVDYAKAGGPKRPELFANPDRNTARAEVLSW